ncbi:MAG TPA: MFS transporter [Steroidobacteraceae bacterium]|nr:MFS transporter [Steroidobacteraceae bacterium]
MTTTTTKRTPIALVALLSFALLINYIDRGSIGIAAPLIQTEFNLSASQMGWVLAAFFWAYAPMQPFMGWLADRIGAERVLVTGFCVWSIATVLTGLATGFVMLFVFRLLMGTGESVAYPSAAKLLATHVETKHRARSMGSVVLGAIVGLTLGAFLGGWLLAHYGWRAMLITLGGAPLLWLIPWFRLWGRRTTSAPAMAQAGPTTITVLKQRALWAGMLGSFCISYAFAFCLTWMPLYLVQERGMSLTAMTTVAGLTFIADGVGLLISAWIVDKWIARGGSANVAYKTVLTISSAGVAASLFLCTVVGPMGAVIALLATGVLDGLNSPLWGSLAQIFAGPQASGRWMGMQNSVANASGMVAPVVTGYLVQQTGNYSLALIVSAFVGLLGLVAWLIVLPPVRPIEWQTASP